MKESPATNNFLSLGAPPYLGVMVGFLPESNPFGSSMPIGICEREVSFVPRCLVLKNTVSWNMDTAGQSYHGASFVRIKLLWWGFPVTQPAHTSCGEG